eukprot:gb/GECG01013871.1/.p1 GENE.gb/GECG01013871.1/~~gb/GECG01013871.1/.p1  ORF type:complete len:392 (+),score=45.55 gb/GECG01013871.1/:1-1176(+)
MVEDSQFRQKKSRKWTQQEDHRLLEAVRLEYFGELPHSTALSWIRIQQHLPWRTCVQIRERYMHVLDPHIRHGALSKDELLSLLRHREEMGNKWVAISRHFPGRTSLVLKNSYHSALRKFRRVHGNRNPEAGEMLRFFSSDMDSSRKETNDLESDANFVSPEYLNEEAPMVASCSSGLISTSQVTSNDTEMRSNRTAAGGEENISNVDRHRGRSRHRLKKQKQEPVAYSNQGDHELTASSRFESGYFTENAEGHYKVKRSHEYVDTQLTLSSQEELTLPVLPSPWSSLGPSVPVNEELQCCSSATRVTASLFEEDGGMTLVNEAVKDKQTVPGTAVPSVASFQGSPEFENYLYAEHYLHEIGGDQQTVPSTAVASASFQSVSSGLEENFWE